MTHLLLLLLVSVCFGTSPALGQESASASADTATPSAVIEPTSSPTPNLVVQYQSDYDYWQNQYQKDYLNYVSKNKIYTTYRTITTQKDRLEATKAVLISRNNLLKSYLVYLRVLLENFKPSFPTETETLQIEQSKWESYYDEQNSLVNAFNNDSDISSWVESFTQNYVAVQQLIYTSLVQHEINQRTYVLNSLKNLTNDIQNSGKIGGNQQWFSDTPITFDLVVRSLQRAQATTTSRQNNPTRFYNFYPDAKVELNRAKNYLSDITSDLKIIVIKNWQ